MELDTIESDVLEPNTVQLYNLEPKTLEQNVLESDILQPDILQLDIPESNTPVKQRRFAEPRYISEVDLCDVATPRRAKRTLTMIKLIDTNKSKQIKRLQDTNRRLNKRIVSLQEMISHIRKKGLISKDAEDVMLVS